MLTKAFTVLVIATILFVWSMMGKTKGSWHYIQVIGAALLMVVGLVHVFEATHTFTFMHWGSPHSVGHYIDLTSATFGISLFIIASAYRLTHK